MSSALLNSWIFFSVLDLAVGGNRNHERIVVDQDDVGVAGEVLDLGVFEKDADDLGVQVEMKLGFPGLDHSVVFVAAFDFMLEGGVDHLVALDVPDLDQERPFGVVELAFLREQLVKHILDVFEQDQLGVVGASGNPAAAHVKKPQAQGTGQNQDRDEDSPDAQARGLDGDDLVIAGQAAVDDRRREQQGNRNRVGQRAGNDVGDEVQISLGDRPMSRACAATMNSTKIAVMVKSASPKERVTSPIT